jgi:hypothetical protein
VDSARGRADSARLRWVREDLVPVDAVRTLAGMTAGPAALHRVRALAGTGAVRTDRVRPPACPEVREPVPGQVGRQAVDPRLARGRGRLAVRRRDRVVAVRRGVQPSAATTVVVRGEGQPSGADMAEVDIGGPAPGAADGDIAMDQATGPGEVVDMVAVRRSGAIGARPTGGRHSEAIVAEVACRRPKAAPGQVAPRGSGAVSAQVPRLLLEAGPVPEVGRVPERWAGAHPAVVQALEVECGVASVPAEAAGRHAPLGPVRWAEVAVPVPAGRLREVVVCLVRLRILSQGAGQGPLIPEAVGRLT